MYKVPDLPICPFNFLDNNIIHFYHYTINRAFSESGFGEPLLISRFRLFLENRKQ